MPRTMIERPLDIQNTITQSFTITGIIRLKRIMTGGTISQKPTAYAKFALILQTKKAKLNGPSLAQLLQQIVNFAVVFSPLVTIIEV